MITKLLMDDREKKSRLVWVQDNYPQLDAEITHLDCGDYHYLTDAGERVVFEYKTGMDFLSSIRNNHLHNQVYEMCTRFDNQFVMVTVASWNELFKKAWYTAHVDFCLNDVMGAIASLNRFTTVIVMPTLKDSFDMMLRQAKKIDQDKLLAPRRNGRKSKNPAVNYLMSIHGLSDNTVKDIYLQFKPRNLEDLLGLTREDLVSINGIGEKKAEMILAGIRDGS